MTKQAVLWILTCILYGSWLWFGYEAVAITKDIRELFRK